MATFSNRLFKSLDRLNQMGQLLLVINNLQGINQQERAALKDLAIQKNPIMIESLTQFKQTKNLENLLLVWRNLLNSPQPLSPLYQQKKPILKQYSFPLSPSMPVYSPSRIPSIKKNQTSPLKSSTKPKFQQSDLITLRDKVGLGAKSPQRVVSRFHSFFSQKPDLSLQEFKLILTQDLKQQSFDKVKKQQAATSLFHFLDTNKNGSLQKNEVLNNLVLLCGGSALDKLEAVFQIYDQDDDGVISFKDLLEHQTQVFRMVFKTQPDLQKKYRQTPETLALVTVQSIFSQYDTDRSKLLTFNQLKCWFFNQTITQQIQQDKANRVQARLKQRQEAKKTIQAIKNRITSPQSLQSISALRKATGLDSVLVYDALKMFLQRNQTGFFSRQQFSEILKEILQKYAQVSLDQESLHHVTSKIFLKFDHDGNGVVDLGEVFCGVSVLCAGSVGDKLKAACRVFDQSRDGIIQIDELKRMFAAVFEVLIEDNVVSIEKLANATALNLFGNFGLKEEEGINYQQFYEWVETTYSHIL